MLFSVCGSRGSRTPDPLLWEQRESNPRPSACKADALNQLSYAPLFSFLFGNNCIILRSSVSHVLMYTPFLFLVFFILAQNKLRNLSSQKNFPFLDCKCMQYFQFCKINQTGLILS